jgi:salicylate hydroxylase
MMSDGHKNDFNVAIIGAGIAGLALAMGLTKNGVPFTLYEEAKEYSAVGAGIGFAPNGLRAMDLIEPGFRPHYEGICVGNKGEGAKHIFFEGMLLEEGLGRDQPWFGKSGWGHPNFDRKSAHRNTLLNIMTSFIDTRNVKFNQRLRRIEQFSDRVRLIFADGEATEHSVVAGADGITSTVREHVLCQRFPKQVEPVYTNAYCYRAVIPIVEAETILGDLTHVAKFYFGHRRSAVTYRISEGKEFNFLLCVVDDDEWNVKDKVTRTVTVEEMMADFEGPGVDERFRQLLIKAKPVRWGFFHHWRTSTYFRDRVVLLGDSAHASLPFQAAGAAQGIEDALILCNVLVELARTSETGKSSRSEVLSALAAYDSVRRPRAQRQMEQAADVGDMIYFQHKEAGSDMSAILSRLQAPGRFDWLWFYDIQSDVDKALSRMQQPPVQASF